MLVHPRLQGSVSLWKLQPEAQAVWVRVRASGIGLGRDVFVACVYIPPAGSAQLLSHSLSERMGSLKAAVTSAQAHGHVILGGDFNAKVGGMDDVLVPDRQFLEGSGIPCQRGCSHPSVNLHGHLLVDLCLATSTLLGTGRVPGDAHAPTSFSRGSSESRLDHFIISRDVFSSVLSSGVACQRFDSDHKPVLLTVLLHDTAAAAVNDSTRPAQPGAPIPRLQWDGAKKAGYVQQMQEQRAALAECHSKVHANQLDLAFQQLGGIMVQAASEAGCRNASGSRAHKGPKGKPYFDRECRELRAKFRYALRHDVDSVKVLARRFSSVIRRKCRQYRQQQTPILLRHLRSNHKVFWQKLNAQDSVLPESLSTHAAWAAFHQNLCAPPATPIQPDDPPQPTRAAPPVDGLEAA